MNDRLRHPPQLKILFLTEMWERFGYYLMLGILPFYLKDRESGGFGWSQTEASAVVGTYIALVYLTPFLGGILADRVLGFRISIVTGAFLMMVGYFLMAIPDNEIMLYVALVTIIIGNGAFKPNISTLLGRLYPAGSPLKDSGYNIFYMGINIGAFFCNFVAAIVRNYFDNNPSLGLPGWNAAFATAGIGMFLGLLIFLFNYGRFKDFDTTASTAPEDRVSLMPLWGCLILALVLGVIGFFGTQAADSLLGYWPFSASTTAFLAACIPVVGFFIYVWRSLPEPNDRNRVAALLVIFAVVVVFWMTFHLNTTALNYWAEQDTHRVPVGPVEWVTDGMPAFAQDAPPSYFFNAGPETERPARESFIIVDQPEYDRRSKANELWQREKTSSGEQTVHVYVTQEMFDKIFNPQRLSTATKTLPKGEPLKLVNPELFESINAGFVVLFTPLVVGFFGLLRKWSLEPTTPAKMGLGLIINAGAPLVMFLATWASANSEFKVSPGWLFGTYAVATIGELFLSPMGLSLVSKVSPTRITAFMMGGYFLSTSIGNKLSGIFGELYSDLNHFHHPAPGSMDHYHFWLILVACNLVFGGFILAILPWLKRQMGSALH